MEASVIVVVVMVVVDALCGYIYTQNDTTSKTTHPVHAQNHLHTSTVIFRSLLRSLAVYASSVLFFSEWAGTSGYWHSLDCTEERTNTAKMEIFGKFLEHRNTNFVLDLDRQAICPSLVLGCV